MAGKARVKPGQRVDRSGIYTSSTSKKRTTLEQGLTAPATPKPHEEWILTTETNPKK
jgi:hypothetical protein